MSKPIIQPHEETAKSELNKLVRNSYSATIDVRMIERSSKV